MCVLCSQTTTTECKLPLNITVTPKQNAPTGARHWRQFKLLTR
nr:MAG TPA: hypothetical protein [Inoviridae sp.]